MHGFTLLPQRGVLAVGGADAVAFLNDLLTNDVSATETRYALLLTPQGKFLHDMFVVPTKDALLIDCEGARLPDLQQRLQRYKLRRAVTIYDVTADYAVVAIAPAVALEAPAAHVFTDLRHRGLGQRAVVARDWLPDLKARCLALGLSETTPEAYDLHRLSVGVPDGSYDLEVERAFPMDYGMDAFNAINFGKGCYVGQELTARMKYRGLVKKQLVRVSSSAPLPAFGTPVMAGENDAGMMCSSHGAAGLALLRTEYAEQPLTCAGTPLTRVKD